MPDIDTDAARSDFCECVEYAGPDDGKCVTCEMADEIDRLRADIKHRGPLGYEVNRKQWADLAVQQEKSLAKLRKLRDAGEALVIACEAAKPDRGSIPGDLCWNDVRTEVKAYREKLEEARDA